MRKNPFKLLSTKRALAVFLVMALAVPAFWFGNPLSPTLKASADTYRKGYALEADRFDRTGIFPDTVFFLTVPDAEMDLLSGTGDEAFRTAKLLSELQSRLTLRNPPAVLSHATATTDSAISNKVEPSTPAGIDGSAGQTTPAAPDGSGGQATPAAFTLQIEPAGRNTFKVIPSHPLAGNTLYFFDMVASDGGIVPFAFQTRKDFGVVGTLPADQSAYVPVDTGIEVYFTHPGVSVDKAHFSISPATDGRFETHGSVVAFVPRKPLTPGTVYTVTVKQGLSLPGTEETLPADLTFQFETSPDEGKSANPDKGWLSIGGDWLEYPTATKPVIPFNLSLPSHLQTDGKGDLSVTVFRYADAQAFVKALDARNQVPYWAWWSFSQNLLPTTGLATQTQYTQSIDFTTMPATWTELPQAIPAGFYLVELQAGSKEDPLKAQALLQVTDTAAWFIEDKTQTLFWLNSLATGNGLSGFTVESLSSGASGTTDAEGLATLTRSPIPDEKAGLPEYFLLRGPNGEQSIYNSGTPAMTAGGSSKSGIWPSGTREGNYWRYAGMDRTLYKPTDTVQFWGFARSRITGTSPEKVTVELAQGGWMYPWMDARVSYWMPMLQKPLMVQTLDVKNGFWDGRMALPNLEPGYYTLSVKQGDEVISTSGFSVENYVKPAWQITATADKKAVFSGETVRFTIQAAFFDGTPVANQHIRYNVQEPDGFREGEGKTDISGNLEVTYQAKYFEGQQGQWWTSLYATAELPETGEVSASSQVQVFLNDIWVDAAGDLVNALDADDFSNLIPGRHMPWEVQIAAGERSPLPADKTRDRVGRVVAQVNKVNLVPLNAPDADGTQDFRGATVAGQVLRATVTRTTWERIETGEDYDFVNKVVIPRYEYREKRETFKTGTFTTDAAGRGVFLFEVPAGTDGSFQTEIRTEDAGQHPMKYNVWHSERGGYPDSSVWHTLETDKDAYRDGETVTATIRRSDEAPATGRTLFVSSWQGIQDRVLTGTPTHQLIFREIMAPNLTLDAVLFDGKTYQAVQNTVRYDAEEKRIHFTLETDKESYRPGDTVELTIKGVDAQGNPVPATVNVSLVDEALLKLSDQYTNVLDTLYGFMDNGIVRRAGGSPYPVYGGRGVMVMGMAKGVDLAFSEAAPMPAASSAAAAPMMAANDGAFTLEQGVVIRSDFRDTAYFTLTTLGDEGTGTIRFTLPHNITDWRVTVSGISDTLHGGNGQASTIVSLPFFLQETLNPTYLAGDEPQVGLTAYGTELTENEAVTFTLTSEDLPGLKATATGKAFERVHLPLGQLKEGSHKVLLTAASTSGRQDAVERTVTVVGSYQEMQKTSTLPLSNGMTIPAGTKGLTRISITDPERAALLDTLHSLAWRSGHRLDQRLVSASAQRWLNTLMEEAAKARGQEPYGLYDVESVDTLSYQRQDGGYGILPYAESDLRMTALMTGLLAENGSTEALKAWFYAKLYATDAAAPAALYGLALLGEPVLTELQAAATVRTATPEDRLFLILGLVAVGDYPTALTLWDKDIAPLLETADPLVRVKEVGYSKDESLQLTALASAAAASLRLPSADGLHAWVRNNGSRNVFTGPEDLMWVKARFQSLPAATLSFSWTYQGKTTEEVLENGAVAFLTIPSVLAGDLRISNVTGTGTLSSTYTAPLEGVGNEKRVSLKRAYYNQATGEKTNRFALNDLVRVELTWDISADAMDGVYEISDWLPAGLAPIDNPWQYGIRPADSFWYRNFEGQQVNFVVGRDWQLTRTLTYYARVTSPGIYMAEGSVMRGSLVKESVLGIAPDRVEITTTRK